MDGVGRLGGEFGPRVEAALLEVLHEAVVGEGAEVVEGGAAAGDGSSAVGGLGGEADDGADGGTGTGWGGGGVEGGRRGEEGEGWWGDGERMSQCHYTTTQ